MAINKLPIALQVTAADMLALFSASYGGDTQVSVATLVAFIDSLAPDAREVTQYAAPAGSGFTAQVLDADDNQDVFYQLTPGGAYAVGGLLLPPAPWNGMRVNVHCSQAVTTFSVTGGTTHGAPTTLAANSFFTLRYDAASGGGWWRCA